MVYPDSIVVSDCTKEETTGGNEAAFDDTYDFMQQNGFNPIRLTTKKALRSHYIGAGVDENSFMAKELLCFVVREHLKMFQPRVIIKSMPICNGFHILPHGEAHVIANDSVLNILDGFNTDFFYKLYQDAQLDVFSTVGWGFGHMERAIHFSQGCYNIATSEFVKRQFLRFGVDVKDVVHLGVDTDFFEQKSTGFLITPEITRKMRKVSGVISFVGRVHPGKGFDVLKSVAKKMDDFIFFCTVGTGRKNPRPLRHLKLPKNIILVSDTQRKEMPSFYNTGDVCFLPSFGEGFGLAAIEALACNVPVVTSNVGYFFDNSIEGAGAIVSNPPTDPSDAADKYVEAIETVLCNRQKLAPRQFVFDRFLTLNNYHQRLMGIIKRY